MKNINTRTILCDDDNIDSLRQRYSNGLHFVMGDLHGEVNTLIALIKKIKFDPTKDFIFFVGDYNAGGDPVSLIKYMSIYYQEDNEKPGFHMIRGNHERELFPIYTLENLADIIVIKGKNINFYIAHAGMVSGAFDLINTDIDKTPDKKVFAYRLDDQTCCYDAPFRQIVWSLRWLYSQNSHNANHSKMQGWPKEDDLIKQKACIIHGHTPYFFLKNNYGNSYGENNIFWEKQHVWFSEELHSFNIDSNVKGRYDNIEESYRGLSCLCLEVYDEIAAKTNGTLTVDSICNEENGVFSVEYNNSYSAAPSGDINTILNAKPEMRSILLNNDGIPVIE